MIILTALLLCVSMCFDNVVVGAAYGMKKIKIGIIPNVIIATITSTGTFISMVFGKQIMALLPSVFSNYLGAIILFSLGLFFVIQGSIHLYKSKKKNNIDGMTEFALMSDTDKSGDISKREAAVLALGLTLNNVAAGIAASFAGINIILTSLLTFVISIISFYLGIVFGKNFIGRVFGKYAPLMAGVILVILSVSQIFY